MEIRWYIVSTAMKQPAKRRKAYGATKDGRIYIYPSLEGPGGRGACGEVASLLEGAANNLSALLRNKVRFECRRQEKR